MRVTPPPGALVSLLLASTLLAAGPQFGSTLQAQRSGPNSSTAGPHLVLQAGRWYHEVNGFVGSARLEFPVNRGSRWLLVPSLTYAHYTLGSPTQVDLFAPEALIHFQLGRGRVRPYVGGGGGLVLLNMFHTFDPIVSVGTGLRADITPALSARFELDAHGFGQLQAGSVGWSVGLARRF
jgi:hypothetical protein